MTDLRIISWNIKDFANTRYTKNCNKIQEQLYDGVNQLCDIFVIIEPKPGVSKGKLGQVVSKGSGYKAMLTLFDWLSLKSGNWKMVPPLMSSNDTRVDCVAVYYDSSKVAIDGPNLDVVCPEPRPVNPPWKDVHPGQIKHCDLTGAKLNFQGRNPYLMKFREVTAVAETTNWVTTLTIKAAPAPVVPASVLTITSPAALPTATCAEAYNTLLASDGATGAVTWKVKTGSTLPVWLNLTTATGALQGTPPATGIFTFDVEATDSSATRSQSCTLEVKTIALTSSAALPSTSQNNYYLFEPRAEWVRGTPKWSIAGALPSGLGIDTNDGVIYGNVDDTATTQTFDIEVTDDNLVKATQTCTITVTNALTITTPHLPDGTENQPYFVELGATGGYRPTAWTTSSMLPAGLELSRSGLLEGTPTASGTFNLTFEASCYPGFFLVALHAPPQAGKNYVNNANILMVKKLNDLREITTERLQTNTVLVGDYNVCDRTCCATKDDHQAFTSMATTFVRHMPANPRSSLAVFAGGNADDDLKDEWKRNAFDHVFTNGFQGTDITNLAVADLVVEHATYVPKAAAVNTITQKEWNAIFRVVLWSAGVSDHLPVRFTLTI
ncbi:putative Ig domain-containing protein [Pseudomonas sp. Marseille-P9899]|uniref:putative Ig domain-containing protein n=1 Tax=Pseudomonas sp. Marseille-P9899 TaxID=2730401 RepID=UPI001588D05A|nr:putative Ig domain-containing protein [Pseudomonas sp. Marseille-P9899]